MPFVVPKPYKTAQKEFSELCATLAEKSWLAYMRNVNQRLYLTGEKKQGLDTLNPQFWIWSSFDIGDENAAAFCVSPEPIPRSLTEAQLCEWMRDRLKSEPMYIFAD